MEKINGRKLSLIFIFILILLVIALLVGKFTYSYLGPTISDDLETQGEVTASGDTLIFTKGNNLSLSASTDNFATGGSNLSTTTNPKVKLIASTKTNEASATYYVGVLIKNNSYVYTTSDKTPEVILTVKDENGNNVTSGVDGLTYVTSGDVSGFDVTDKTGLFNIKTDYPISTTSSSAGTTHTWTFTLTFVNLSTDQSDNENASMNVDIYLQKEKYNLPTLAEYVISQYTGTQGENGIYYHDSSLTNGAGDNSYRYAGHGEDYYTCEYNGNSVSRYDEKDNEPIYNKSLKGNCSKIYKFPITVENGSVSYGYFDKSLEGFWSKTTLTPRWNSENNSCVVKTKDGEEALVNGISDLTSESCFGTVYQQTVSSDYFIGIEELGAGKETFYSSGVNNFVCFGSNTNPCPTDNLYRIIGVFGDINHGVNGSQLVKLIKYDYNTKKQLGEDGDYKGNYTPSYFVENGTYKGSQTTLDLYYWNNNTQTNTWSESLLNKINLNINFINNIGTTWASKIATTKWKAGGNTWNNISDSIPSVAYINEIISPITTNTTDNASEYSAKIGLAYASDYGFAADPSAWITSLTYYRDKGEDGIVLSTTNWMYMDFYEWLISRDADNSDSVFAIYDGGRVYGNKVDEYFGVRVAFNLEPSVTYVSGSGTMSDPVRIN